MPPRLVAVQECPGTSTNDRLHAGIEVVFASYEPHPDAEALLQRWINDPVMTAVVTTRVAGSGAPYVVVALDFSGRPDAITGRAAVTAAPWYVARSARESATVPPEIRMLLRYATEVEQVTGTDAVTVLEHAAAKLRDQVTTRVAADPDRVWSCVPADTDEATATAVVQAQLALLRERPNQHDKIEFEIAATCLTPAFADRVRNWSDHGVTAAQINRIRTGLARITAAAVVRLPQDLAMLRESEARRLSSQPDLLVTGQALLACAREAALLLAHLARAAFMVKDVLITPLSLLNAEKSGKGRGDPLGCAATRQRGGVGTGALHQ